ncbi:MAG: hypothetical protein LUD27_07330 [Clostridia bacterium]|nr:hypothetical protein [Clostridia bacterium]
MRSKVKRALCCVAALAVTAGMAAMSACNNNQIEADDSYYDGSVKANSNGGFAVETGDYIYFINGSESYDADNTFGDVEKGSIVRIKRSDYAAGNYTEVETVVPLIAYSGNYDSGIYIYGDRIYYSTPSTNRDSSGEVLNSQLEFKSTKLDGTGTKSYTIVEDSSVEYRFVESEGGDVYLLYAVSENIFEDTTSSVTNIHSLQLTGDGSGTNTLLAYDVDEYVFDSDDLTNPYVYYTMEVTYNLGTGYDGETTDYSSTAAYNQVYRVSAFETVANEYDFSYVIDVDGDKCYEYESNPLYVNCGQLVFDGIGAFTQMTQFNYGWKEYAAANDLSAADSITGYRTDTASLSGYSYSLTGYSEGNLYYTRTNTSSDSGNPIWFYVTEDEIDEGFASTEGWNAVTENVTVSGDLNNLDDHILLISTASATSYTVFTDDNNKPEYLMSVDSGAAAGYGILWEQLDGKGGTVTGLANKYYITTASGEITYLTTSEESVDGTEYTFLYYSVGDEADNGYSVHRIALKGSYDDYNKYPVDDSAASNYTEVTILDLVVDSGWYMPEIIDSQFMFLSASDDMVDYNYIMVCDLRASANLTTTTSTDATATISNYDIENLNALYDDVIATIDDTDTDNYQYLKDALYYAFYTRDKDYLGEIVQLWVDEGELVNYLYSNESQKMYIYFIEATNDYADYGDDSEVWTSKDYSGFVRSKTVNGDTVYSTSRDYFYTLIGYMSEDDEEAYTDYMRSTYMQAEPEESWWDGLETWVKVIFIVGVSLGGLIVIAAAVLIPML